MRSLLKGFVAGLVGVAVGLLIYHLWLDHALVHEMNQYLLQHAAAINKLP